MTGSTVSCSLPAPRTPAVRKLENSLLKLYAVTCVSSKQPERLKEFFERLAPELQGQAEWKDWFALPWVKEPQDNTAFSLYFTRYPHNIHCILSSPRCTGLL